MACILEGEAVCIPSGHVIMMVSGTMDEPVFGLRWSVQGDAADKNRACAMLKMLIDEYPECRPASTCHPGLHEFLSRE